MRNDNLYIFRVYLIIGYIEFLNVDVVVCLCIFVMFFVNDCFGLYSKYSRVFILWDINKLFI